MKYLIFILLSFIGISTIAQTTDKNMDRKEIKTDKQWVKELSPEQYKVLRQCGTEPPFSGKYVNFKEDGYYYCAACGAKLFSSDTKYDSGSGWPSFYAAADSSNIEEVLDKSHGMIRTEIKCKKCGGHLGHLFNDGPNPTGMRYCVNSAALDFKKEK